MRSYPPPEPVNGTIFGTRIFVDVTKLGSLADIILDYLGTPKSNDRRYELNWAPLKRCAGVLTPRPQNVTGFGNWVFTAVIKLK